MGERGYTVNEMDALRSACKLRYLYGTSVPDWSRGSGMSRGYKEAEMERVVEERVRTHMMAGHLAQDLIDEDTRKFSKVDTPSTEKG